MKFSKELSIGNRILDSEHMKLHDIINRIACSIAVSDMATLSDEFELLESCLCAYFVLEENIAQAINFDFSQHRLTHQRLLNMCQQARYELIVENGAWLEFLKIDVKYYIDSLKDYLIQHIRKDSKPLSIVLNAHFYDLNPNVRPSK